MLKLRFLSNSSGLITGAMEWEKDDAGEDDWTLYSPSSPFPLVLGVDALFPEPLTVFSIRCCPAFCNAPIHEHAAGVAAPATAGAAAPAIAGAAAAVSAAVPAPAAALPPPISPASIPISVLLNPFYATPLHNPCSELVK